MHQTALFEFGAHYYVYYITRMRPFNVHLTHNDPPKDTQIKSLQTASHDTQVASRDIFTP